MSGMAGNVTAFNTVWTFDLYQSYIHKGASDAHYLKMGRWTTVVGIPDLDGHRLRGAGLQQHYGYAAAGVFHRERAAVCDLPAGHVLEALHRARGLHGSGQWTLAAVLHHGLTVPASTATGIHGGWLHVVHVYPSAMALNFYQAIIGVHRQLRPHGDQSA